MTAAALDTALARAENDHLAPLELLEAVLGEQATARRERSVQRRVYEAHFAEHKILEGFDWKFNQQAIDRLQIEELATGDFIRRHSNLIIVGQSGVGKSHIIQSIGMRACTLGYRVLYKTSAQLLTDLSASLADKTLSLRLRHYARPELLIIDEFGFDRIERLESPEAPHLLYKVITARHQKHSTAVVTNVDFDGWSAYLNDGPLATALLDRLVEGATILKIKGKSYRARQAKTLTPSSQDQPS